MTRADDDAKRSFEEERRTTPADDDAKRSFEEERRTTPADDNAKRSFEEERRTTPADDDAKRSFEEERRTTPADDDAKMTGGGPPACGGERRTIQPDLGRIPSSGRLRDLGLINWILAKSAARTVGAPQMHLFTTLGQHKRLFLAMMPYSGALLRGRLARADTELVILRVAHLRNSEYELQHHRLMGRRRGLDEQTQQAIFTWPDSSEGLTDRQQVLLSATDEFVNNRSISGDVWEQLARHLDRRQLIEFCMLAGQYDGLAATMSALKIPLDHPQ